MNSHLVPDFQADMEEDCSIPTTSGFSRPKKPTTGEEEIMELLWHNGQVVIQSQNRQGLSKSKHPLDPTVEDPHPRINGHDQSNISNHQQHNSNLFMQEDEMATWLQHYPVLDDPIDPNPFEYADLLYTAAPPLPAPSLQPPPPPPPPAQPASARQNFAHFSRLRRDHPYNSSTVVESNETPNVVVMEKTTTTTNNVEKEDNNVTRELTGGICEMTVTSSSPVRSGASTYSASGDQARGKHAEESVGVVMVINEDKKRKAKDQNECHSQDVEVEASEARKQARSSSTKRSRAAEVHNLSERRRRDRINEKMRALQELIPRCNKSDKASMLDEAIEYLKSLQMQVQMMSMGCGMVPMMYPGMQQYLPAMQMGMGMGVGMGMGMDMTMTRPPMVPYPSVLPPGSSIPNPAATISAQPPHNMAPRFPIVQFHMPQTGPPPVPDPSGAHTPTVAAHQVQNLTHPRMPNFVDPYQQFLGMHQGQLQFPQPGANKASTSKDVGNTENQQNG